MGYLLHRILSTLPVMGVVAVVVFMLIHLSPGDPAALIAGDLATEDDIARLRESLGLNEPLWRQFVIWAGGLFTGDLGTSIFTQVPVSQLLAQRIEPTVSIAGLTMLVTLLLAIPLGTLAAYRAMCVEEPQPAKYLPERLTPEEARLFKNLHTPDGKNLRLEQERIGIGAVRKAIETACGGE